MPVIGSFARVEVLQHDAVRARLAQFAGVTPFELGVRGRIGLVIEAADMQRANELLGRELAAVAGVLGVFPVSVEFEDEPEGA